MNVTAWVIAGCFGMSTDPKTPRGRARLDVAALYAALDTARRARHLTWRQVAQESGASPSTLSRMGAGKYPDVHGLVALCDWAGHAADSFISRRGRVPVPDVLGAVAALLREDPAVRPEQREWLVEIVTASYRVFTGGPRHTPP